MLEYEFPGYTELFIKKNNFSILARYRAIYSRISYVRLVRFINKYINPAEENELLEYEKRDSND